MVPQLNTTNPGDQRLTQTDGHWYRQYSIYDALASDYPVYAELKKAATVPDAHVFRIKPDGKAYMNESKENKDLLPPLSE